MKPALAIIPLLALAACQSTPPAADSPAPLATPPSPAAPALLSAWSPTVAGLRFRIEDANGIPNSYFPALFVRIQNVGIIPISLPDLNLPDPQSDTPPAPGPWQVDILTDNVWTTLPAAAITTAPYGPYVYRGDADPLRDASLFLLPNESALIPLRGAALTQIAAARPFKIRFSGEWLDAKHSVELTASLRDPPQKSESLSLPEIYPSFSPIRFLGGNMSGHESQIYCINISNSDLVSQISIYPAAQILPELELRMRSKRDVHMKLYYALQAALLGSTEAKNTILQWRQTTDYETTISTLEVLKALAADPQNQWAQDAIIDALNDRRPLTIPSDSDPSPDFDTVRDLAIGHQMSIIQALGSPLCRKAVPTLIDIVSHEENTWDAIEALGNIGDPRAIPALREIARNPAGRRVLAIQALAKLHDPGTFDLIAAQIDSPDLDFTAFNDLVNVLEDLHDPRAVPLLRRIAAAPPATQPSADAPGRIESARLALATLEPGDPVPRLTALVADLTLDSLTRMRAIDRLHNHIDPRVIPILLQTIRQDPDGAVVRDAIFELQQYPVEAAISGLIDSFQIDFSTRRTFKITNPTAYFHNLLAQSLAHLTAQPLGPNPAEWRQWWQSAGHLQFTSKLPSN